MAATPKKNPLSRRSFLGLTAAAVASTITNVPATAGAADDEGNSRRARKVRAVRKKGETVAMRRGFPEHVNNGDEQLYPYEGNFSKGLPHNVFGDVSSTGYRLLLNAVEEPSVDNFNALLLGDGAKKLRNPLASLAFDLEGCDSQQFIVRPHPKIDSTVIAAEMAELYWESLARDISFDRYETDPTIAAVCDELSRLADTGAPKEDEVIAPSTVFRGSASGCTAGPYVSQLLLRDLPLGTWIVPQRQETVLPGIDYVTELNEWLRLQSGARPTDERLRLDSVHRYIRNGRDLAQFVRIDRLFHVFEAAAMIIQFRLVPGYDYQFGSNAPFNPELPYRTNPSMTGFSTFDYPHLLSLIPEAGIRALKAAWFQKWLVHRRLRPEEFGGRIHNRMIGRKTYHFHGDIVNTTALDQVFSRNGTYFLPQAYPEGCPTDPAYPSGHAAVAGACATILKFWFDESYILEDPVIPDSTGLSLVPYNGDDRDTLTLGGEINKLAYNVTLGTSWGGINWRSDATAGIRLGEELAIALLRCQAVTFAEPVEVSFTRFNGQRITIRS